MDYPGNQIDGWMDPAELEWLYRTARDMGSVVEVGCWKGRSAHALLSACPGPVYAVDHWQGSRDARAGAHREAVERNIFADFLANVGGFENLIVKRGASPGMAAECPDADMIFIDGGHAYDEVLADVKAWRPKARKVFCGHDWQSEEIQRALRETLGEPHGVVHTIWFYLL